MVSPAVGRGRTYAASFVTPFRLWNYGEVISTSRSAAILATTVDKNVAHCRTGPNVDLFVSTVEQIFRFEMTLLSLKLAKVTLLVVLARNLGYFAQDGSLHYRLTATIVFTVGRKRSNIRSADGD